MHRESYCFYKWEIVYDSNNSQVVLVNADVILSHI